MSLGHSPSRWNDARQNWTATQCRLTEAVVCVQATGSELRPWKQSLASVSQVESAPQQGARAAGRETWGHQTLVTPGGSLCGFCRRPQRLSIWSLNCVRHFATPMHNSTPGFPVPSLTPGSCSNSCPSSRWCHSTISSSVVPFPSSCLQSFPASGSFPVSHFCTSGGQSIGVLASVLPMNIQDWFPLGLTGLISLQSKGLLRVFSNTTLPASLDNQKRV